MPINPPKITPSNKPRGPNSSKPKPPNISIGKQPAILSTLHHHAASNRIALGLSGCLKRIACLFQILQNPNAIGGLP
jgi:hypothetical protein